MMWEEIMEKKLNKLTLCQETVCNLTEINGFVAELTPVIKTLPETHCLCPAPPQ